MYEIQNEKFWTKYEKNNKLSKKTNPNQTFNNITELIGKAKQRVAITVNQEMV